MAAADSSVLISYIQGDTGAAVERFDAALAANDVVLPPAVLVEILGQPGLPWQHEALIRGLPVLDILEGYWVRAAKMRAQLLNLRLRSPIADVLIAQSCIDHDVALITRDVDFKHFAEHCGLKLA